MDATAIQNIFQSFNQTKIGVVGDIMLDTYWWGSVDRISPEAPVPIVSLQRKELRVGGAANVALNLRSLGAPTTLFAVIGKDAEGADLTQLLQKEGIDTKPANQKRCWRSKRDKVEPLWLQLARRRKRLTNARHVLSGSKRRQRFVNIADLRSEKLLLLF
ncbi:MAG: hypothetical protein EBU08_07550 [Micrococcales bacterium]|nr:hypothetical protein [Micrococcales bacterium]